MWPFHLNIIWINRYDCLATWNLFILCFSVTLSMALNCLEISREMRIFYHFKNHLKLNLNVSIYFSIKMVRNLNSTARDNSNVDKTKSKCDVTERKSDVNKLNWIFFFFKGLMYIYFLLIWLPLGFDCLLEKFITPS